jgi:hypothetical protein
VASFNRADYRRVYEIGISLYVEFTEFPETAALGSELIEMAEGCIGQQSESRVLYEDE